MHRHAFMADRSGPSGSGITYRLAANQLCQQTFVLIRASKSQSSSPLPTTISTICPRNWDRRSLCRAAITLGVPQTVQLSGITAREESILCNAGDVVLFRSEVWHRGSANTSNQVRYLMQVHYAMRMITQKYPPYLNKFQFDESILAQATPRQRQTPRRPSPE